MIRQTYGFFMPSVSLMGIGAINEIGARVASLGSKKPLIVTDSGMVKLGKADLIAGLIKKATGHDAVIYDKTVPNPTDNNVHEGVEVFKKNNCDAIITLGGGSSHDCGKGIGIVATNGKRIHDYEGVDKSTKAMPPFIAVNTTAGTASEMTRFCIITNTSNHVKMAIVDWRTTPNVAINDPELMEDMPPFLTACTGMDALTHAIEAYVSTIATPVTDACALQAISLISKHLRVAVANGHDMNARNQMAYAQYLAGMAFNNASLGYVHAMSHQLGGFYNLPHGMCNAILLPHVSRFNLISRLDRFCDVARALGENIDGLSPRAGAEKALEAIQVLSKDVGIPAGLKEANVKEQDFQIMAENAMKDACGFTNPRVPTLKDVIGIFAAAMARDRRSSPLRCSASASASPRPTGKPKPSKSNSSPSRRHKVSKAPQGKKSPSPFSFLFRGVQQVARDGSGRIVRSFSARKRFLDSLGLEKLPRGYEVDHVKPLFAGGKDHESNMQLLPKKVHQEKTRQDFKHYKEQLAASRQSGPQKTSSPAQAKGGRGGAVRSPPASAAQRKSKSSKPSTARNGKDSGLFGFLSRLFG
eukprot:gene1955-2133_t